MRITVSKNANAANACHRCSQVEGQLCDHCSFQNQLQLDAIECVCDTKGKENSDKPAVEVHQSNCPQNNQTNYTSTTIPAVVTNSHEQTWLKRKLRKSAKTSVDVELPVLEPSTIEAITMVDKQVSRIAPISTISTVCQDSVHLSRDSQRKILVTWMENGEDMTQLHQSRDKFPSIGAQVVPIVHKAMKVRNKSQEEKLPVKVFWTVVSKTVMRSWDFFKMESPNPGLTWQDMCPSTIEYLNCSIQNDTPFNFEVVEIDIKYPNSSPRKGSVRGLRPKNVVNAREDKEFQIGDRRARNWFSAIVSIVFRCDQDWYMHVFYYPTDCGIHVAFTNCAVYSWDHLGWKERTTEEEEARLIEMVDAEKSGALKVGTSVDNQLDFLKAISIEFEIEGSFNDKFRRNELYEVKIRLRYNSEC